MTALEMPPRQWRPLLLLHSTQVFDDRQYAVPDDVFWIAREVKVRLVAVRLPVYLRL
jgi:hypothetical protein